VALPSAANASEVLQPSERAFDLPAVPATAQRSSILGSAPVAAVGRDHFYSAFAQALIQLIAIVGFVSDHALGQGADLALLKRGFDQSGFIRRSARNPDRDRSTAAVCNCHDLAPLPQRVGPMRSPPFLPR